MVAYGGSSSQDTSECQRLPAATRVSSVVRIFIKPGYSASYPRAAGCTWMGPKRFANAIC